jgi:hypothetical protein
MATLDKGGIATQEELIISSLMMGDAVAELLIEKGLISRDEFIRKLSGMRDNYRHIWERAKKGTTT